MLSENFVRPVAHQPRGSGVPTDHVSRRIELENSVLLHALDDQTKSFFAFAQSALRPPLLGDVLKKHAKETRRQRKYLDGVNAFADALIPVSDFPQILRLLRAQGFKTRNRKRRFQ